MCMGLDAKPQYVPNSIKNYVLHTLSDTAKVEKTLGFRAIYSLVDSESFSPWKSGDLLCREFVKD
jgi:hypothetical protein